MRLRAIGGEADRGRLREFYEGVYLAAFARQREPIEVWERMLWGGGDAYVLAIVIAEEDAGAIAGGVVCEWYPASACGFLTYLVVAEGARRRGLGRALVDEAKASVRAAARARGGDVRAVFAEVDDPDRGEVERARMARFARWGARVIDWPYVQPSLGPGLARDHGLRLIAFFDGAPPPRIEGAIVRAFVGELYAATEAVAIDAGVPDWIDVRDA